MRASDADRDRVADLLGTALAEGRLSAEEHSERLDSLYAAKTYSDLEVLTEDLPTSGSAPRISLHKELPPPARHSDGIVAIFGGADRKGRWLAAPRTNVTCVFGGIELDFREAVLSQREVVVNVTCVFGGVEITIPPGVRVENSTAAIFGGVESPGNDTLDPSAPVIRITGFVLFGGIGITRKLLKDQQRALRAQQRQERRDRKADRHGGCC
ncbi:MAG: DUF1707 domain-containing protein [Streptosporangiaceae bacterium]